MASLFGPRSNRMGILNPTTQNPMQTPTQQIQNSFDRETIVENAIQQSGGDAKAAFYMAAKQMGLDPNDVLAQMQSMGDMKTMAQKAMSSNPKLKRIASLFSLMK